MYASINLWSLVCAGKTGVHSFFLSSEVEVYARTPVWILAAAGFRLLFDDYFFSFFLRDKRPSPRREGSGRVAFSLGGWIRRNPYPISEGIGRLFFIYFPPVIFVFVFL